MTFRLTSCGKPNRPNEIAIPAQDTRHYDRAQAATCSQSRHLRSFVILGHRAENPETSENREASLAPWMLGTGPEHDERDASGRPICERRALGRRRSTQLSYTLILIHCISPQDVHPFKPTGAARPTSRDGPRRSPPTRPRLRLVSHRGRRRSPRSRTCARTRRRSP